MLVNPIYVLRGFCVVLTVSLVVAMFVTKGGFWPGFLIGFAAAISIGVHSFIWGDHLHWEDKAGPQPVQLNLNEPGR